jgi:hypothetical protein
MGLAPNPKFSENQDPVFEHTTAPNIPGNRGPLRFEEGIATDTDVPSDFTRGMREGSVPAPGSVNHVNPDTQWKHADETMRERAHVGSAAWVEAPTFLSGFKGGASNEAEIKFIQINVGNTRKERANPATVRD